ncbi:hypothetical protein EP7_000786 [Isosphaeraceae bacterium EP7]
MSGSFIDVSDAARMFVFAVLVMTASTGHADEQMMLMEEAKSGWTALERVSDQTRMEGHEITRPINRPEAEIRVEERDYRFTRKGHSLLMIRSGHTRNGEFVLSRDYTRVGCVSERRCFVLDRSNPAHKFNILEVSEDDPTLRMQLSAIMRKYLDAPWRVSGKSFAEFVADPGFLLRDMRLEDVDGVRLARLSFEFNPSKQPDSAIRRGTFWFDPARSWANVRCETRTSDGTFHREIQYRGKSNCPARIVDELKMADGKGTRFEFDCSACSHGEVTDDEFTLPQFELEEPKPKRLPAPTAAAPSI